MDESTEIGFSTEEEDDFDELMSSFRFEEDPMPARTNEGQILTVQGVRVEFPYKPYKSQVQMMDHIIAGVQRGENCLLESPTGTGKTAAILCSLLGWQRKCGEMGPDYWHINFSSQEHPCTCNFDIYPDVKIVQVPNGMGDIDLLRCALEDEEDNCSTAESPSKKRKVVVIPEEKRTRDELCGPCLKRHFKESCIPRIYYATRTHSQISQVVKQLKETEYCRVPMCILSSRKNSCTNENVLKASSGVDEGCRTLRAGYYKNTKNLGDPKRDYKEAPVCSYYKPTEKMTHFFPSDRNNLVWDIEDIVQYGKQVQKCPFYGCRDLHDSASIVFLPYNYLLERSIRSSLKIRYPNSILVFDEAHNIEQFCCDSMTVDVPLEHVDTIRIAFDYLITPQTPSGKSLQPNVRGALENLCLRLRTLSNWIGREAAGIVCETTFDGSLVGKKTFSGDTLLETLKQLKLTKPDIVDIMNNLGELSKTEEERKRPNRSIIQGDHSSFFDDIVKVLTVIYDQQMKRLPDFRASLEKKFLEKGDKHQITFSIFCLNAGIAFEDLRESARTIIVTSGTLSPLLPFASELETNFEKVLSAGHVVDSSQVWAGVLRNGLTTNLTMELNARSLRKPEIIDEMGQIVLNICKIVPNGVLVFLPSYKTIELCRTHWSRRTSTSVTPFIQELDACKDVFYEDSKDSIEAFKINVRHFQQRVLVGNGAVFFAVFRGKLSEGVDFKDEQARAVVTFGIPYPFHGIRVNLKKAYNDEKVKNKISSLNGQNWYSAQAFRAMNQAFGRCLRHRNDWGALILIDSRIPSNRRELSGWVNNFLREYDTGQHFLTSLRDFVKNRVAADTAKKAELEFREQSTVLLGNNTFAELPTQNIKQESNFSSQ